METEYADKCNQLHEAACAKGEMSYLDPQTGLMVFTRLYLLKRPCCKTGCRHCPYGFKKEKTIMKEE